MSDALRRQCSVSECETRHMAYGYCQRHYRAALRRGEIQKQRVYGHIEDPIERMASYSRVDGSCIRWIGGHDKEGYGKAWHEGKAWLTHRLSWTLANGPIPPGALIDHLCHVPDCFNVDHLRLVNNRQNGEHRAGPNRNNSSGYLGVRKRNKAGTFSAVVSHKGQTYWVGSFATAEEAAEAVRIKRNELFTHNDMDRKTA